MNKPKLIEIAPGDWVNPMYVAAVRDSRDEISGSVDVVTWGWTFSYYVKNSRDEAPEQWEKGDNALKALGINNTE